MNNGSVWFLVTRRDSKELHFVTDMGYNYE
jgi:hypothetical protein